MKYLDELCMDGSDMLFERRLFDELKSRVVIDTDNAFLFVRDDLGLVVVEVRTGWEDQVVSHLYTTDVKYILTRNSYLIDEFGINRKDYPVILFHTEPSYHMTPGQVRDFVERKCVVKEPTTEECRMILGVIGSVSTGIRPDEIHNLYYGHNLYVLLVDKQIVGFAVLSTDRLLRYLYISPEYRGHSYGIYLSRYIAENNNSDTMYALCPLTGVYELFTFIGAGYEAIPSDLHILERKN